MDKKLLKANAGKRIGAFLIDFVILSALLVVSFLIYILPDIQKESFNLFNSLPVFLIITFVLYCLKDIFGGVSLGKWTFGLVVRNNDDNQSVPSPIKLFFRNMLTIIWPIELIVFLCSKDKHKIGDKVFNTDVYDTSKKVKPVMIIITAIVFVVMMFSFFVGSLTVGINLIIKNDDSYKTAITYIETNEEIKNIVGDIKGYGYFIQGDLSYKNNSGNADYIIKVKGNKRDLNVRLILEKRSGQLWQIIEYRY